MHQEEDSKLETVSSIRKKKILFGIISSSILTLGGASIAKHALHKYRNNHISYEICEDGTQKISGDISYNVLSDYYIIYINSEFYIVEKIETFDGKKSYYNIFNNEKIFETLNSIEEEKLENYLISNNMVKDYYTEEEIEKILININNKEKIEKNKVKIKK